jgi:hypothetical protein
MVIHKLQGWFRMPLQPYSQHMQIAWYGYHRFSSMFRPRLMEFADI